MQLTTLTSLFFLLTTLASTTQIPSAQTLEKRKGGGGGRGGGGGGGRGGGGRGSGTGSGRPPSSYSFSSQSNLGGRTRDGSGPPPPYSGRYLGGTSVPYTAGRKSPTRGITPAFLPIGAFALFPGIWLFSSLYAYPYGGYHYYNSARGRNETANVTCVCQEYSVCGCDPQDNSTLLAQQLTNGSLSGPPVNTSTVRTVDYNNGTIISVINGTLDNGTTATGGTDPSNQSEVSGAVRAFVETWAGYWGMVAVVVAAVMV